MKLFSTASAAAMPCAALLAGAAMAVSPASWMPGWVATWHASPQPVWRANFLFSANVPAVLKDQTVRQIACISPRFDSGNHLHRGDEGNRAMAEAVDLEMLARSRF